MIDVPPINLPRDSRDEYSRVDVETGSRDPGPDCTSESGSDSAHVVDSGDKEVQGGESERKHFFARLDEKILETGKTNKEGVRSEGLKES